MLEAGQKRVEAAKALGLDETPFLRLGPRRWRMWVTSATDIHNHRLIEFWGVFAICGGGGMLCFLGGAR